MTLQERDKKHLWHPLKQHQTHPDSLGIVKAKGCILTDEKGNEYIDAISSWYTCMFGHCNDFITSRVYKQMQTLDQIMFSDFTHEPAVKLSEELIKILPKNQNRIFFNDNGSTAVEASIKMALQYYFNKGEKRSTFIAFENGFHGDTFGAMSVSGLSAYNGPFEDFLMDIKRIPVPDGKNNDEILSQLKEIISQNDIAGFIYEPLVQGAAGMKIHKAADLNEILKYLKNKNILTIADEVMTGFGKTGNNFASDEIATKPDIICLSKALTGGLVPMAITSCTEEIYSTFLSNDIAKGFFHCHTYSANPIACSAALASIELLQTKEIQDSIEFISNAHKVFEDKIKQHSKVASTRSKGVILAIDLKTNANRYGSLRDELLKYFMEDGVFLRPLGNTIYIQPPYVITEKQLKKVYTTIEKVLDIF
ncbi:adenosylmethionine--8-amino-7-oxononanoate transaminase [Tenacibaculum finnmarkense genomovar finnmarkense]|uniref:adenosylmethionine--8-amino-7-oxononanoate transaminase n=1 Tax=Tenacibaculum finnmarkense TaxID=2781243 RepID=UPI001E4E15EC|nr:adenosylmethionine--8-amino-7-oxononanoate transaminase [Tenacibaculum finnmarkense]MCD8416615.1 adenosylmethionine--8-amino-7-oxononanoate transaminase [Tenacibaculum finnmarkense genomovar finnmarkense]MCG8185182.1 adenosylmethionine--8-amino-7-oxononanoate transaminase [Tenacibaculum finnmarkense genomovar finnmarkense]MCG8201549.1 adenosylmethionine--8-amino-7-oxononanoate transaminase [Tenacibaculum finnmarkense genomovar finnmarkense]MCG8209314.1 adenosylmethionine--8-amino-7-oxononano